jgi:hypothetical protein
MWGFLGKYLAGSELFRHTNPQPNMEEGKKERTFQGWPS